MLSEYRRYFCFALIILICVRKIDWNLWILRKGKYTSYTPKHIDTPEEVVQKYYAGVLKEQQKVCDEGNSIQCTNPPPRDMNAYEEINETSGKIMVSPPDIAPGSCKMKRKGVRFSDSERCAIDRNDLCSLNKEITHCDCTDYNKDCPSR